MVMYNEDTELLFPLRVIPKLLNTRGAEWNVLVKKMADPRTAFSEQLAFAYMMVRLNGCISCNTGSFRAMRGCTQCSIQTVKRYRNEDAELLALYEKTRKEVALLRVR